MVNLLAGVGLRRGLEGPASGPLSTSASSYSSAGSPLDGVVGVCLLITMCIGYSNPRFLIVSSVDHCDTRNARLILYKVPHNCMGVYSVIYNAVLPKGVYSMS